MRSDDGGRRRRRVVAVPGILALYVVALVPSAPLRAQTLDEAIEDHLAGRLDRALRAYEVVAGRDLDSDPIGVAIARNNACMIRMDRGQYSAARQQCEAAAPLLEGTDLEELRAQNLNNLGVVYQNLGRFEDAARDLRRAEALNRAAEAWDGVAINLANRGSLALVRGRYGAALELQQAAEMLAAAHRQESWAPRQEVVARINQAVVWEKLGEHRRSLELLATGLERADEMTQAQAGTVLVNTGVIYRNLGDPVRAADRIEAAIEGFRQLGDDAGLSNAWLNLGLVQYLNLGRLGEAERSMRRALDLARRSGSVIEQVQDLFYLGSVLGAAGQMSRAEQAFVQCRNLATEVGSAEGQWSSLAGLARLRVRRGDDAGALKLLDEAMTRIETLRSGLDVGLRSGFFGDKRPVYAEAVAALWRLHSAAPDAGYDRRAYLVTQRAKNRELLDVLGTPDDAVAPATARRVQESLGAGMLIEYFVGSGDAYLWRVERDHFSMLRIDDSASLGDDVREVIAALAGGTAPPSQALRSLGDGLLGPAAGGLEPDRRVRIAPDGVLAWAPFALLQVGGGRPVVERSILSIVPSGSLLVEDREPEASGPLRTVGFAGGSVEAASPQAAPGASERLRLLARRFDLRPLPAAAAEIRLAAETLGGDAELFGGERATESAFRRAASAGPTVLHIASHAVLDPRSAGGSAIVLSGDDSDDGLLHAGEVARLSLPVDLAVLAACRTAIGNTPQVSPLDSLTGAFLAAGVRAVVATLWDVDDASTAAFMRQYYYYLGRGRPADEALRQTQLRLAADPRWNHPEIWAAFVLYGRGDRALVPPSAPWRGLTIVSLLLAVTSGVVSLLAWRRGLPARNPAAG